MSQAVTRRGFFRAIRGGPEPEPEPQRVAVIDETRCLPFRGPECGACAGLCPPDAPALELVRWRPEIDPEVCTGCGACVDACPVRPAAVLVQ